jgi:molecular chaperone GrpE
MTGDGEQGNFKAEIPEEAIAEALAAVEKHAGEAAATEIAVDGSGASTTAADEASAQRERELRAQLAEEHDLRLRALADLENYRKRVVREREQQHRAGAEELLRDLLPVLDNMDRALAALPEGPLAIGVSMTQRHLEETLKRHGLKPFTVKPGTEFDPRVHDAVNTIATHDHPAGTIVEQELRGYYLHDRLLRPASVIVASVPAVDPEGRTSAGLGSADTGGDGA